MIFVVCGVSGAGKTTIGQLLAQALGVPFHDADDYHPAPNIKKMRNGIPLDDEDRRPWLETLSGKLPAWEQEGGAVLACSALKESYRGILGSQCGDCIQWIVLHAPEELLADRLESRKGHYFDPGLLRSQLDAFESPAYGWHLEMTSSPQKVVNDILMRMDGE